MRNVNDFINGYANAPSCKSYASEENARKAFEKSPLASLDPQEAVHYRTGVAYMCRQDGRWVVVVFNYPNPIAPAQLGFVSWA